MTAPATAGGSRAAEANEAPDARRIGVNLLVLTAGEIVAKFVTFLAFSYLARTLGPDRYGNLEFTLAAMVFFTLPADLGLGSYGAREIARNHRNAVTLLGEIVEIRLVLSALSIVALAAFIWLVPKPLEVKLLLSLYGLSLLPSSLMLQWYFQAHDQMHWVASASIVRQSVFALLVFGVFRPGMNIAWVGGFEAASVGATAAVCVWLARSRMGASVPPLRFPVARLLPHLRQSLPIGLTELAWAFTWYFVTVLLGLLFERAILSFFGASHRVLMAMHTFVWLYFFNLLPSISRLAGQPPERLRELIRLSMTLAGWGGFFVAFFMTAVARDALALVYGRPFAEAGDSFSILVWMLPIAMLSGHYRYVLIGFNLQGLLFRCTALSGAAAVALGFLLVPGFGAAGGAWSLLAANAINFALVYFAVRRHVAPLPFWREISRPALALALAAIVFLALRGKVSNWVAAGAGSIVYAGMLATYLGRQAFELLRLIRPAPAKTIEECAG